MPDTSPDGITDQLANGALRRSSLMRALRAAAEAQPDPSAAPAQCIAQLRSQQPVALHMPLLTTFARTLHVTGDLHICVAGFMHGTACIVLQHQGTNHAKVPSSCDTPCASATFL